MISAALAALGLLYLSGIGVAQEPAFGYFWLLLAVAQGHEDARACLDRIMPILTPAQVNAAQKAALNWRPLLQ